MSPLGPWLQIPLCGSRPSVVPEPSQHPCPMCPGALSSSLCFSCRGMATAACGCRSLGAPCLPLASRISVHFHPLCHQFPALNHLPLVQIHRGVSLFQVVPNLHLGLLILLFLSLVWPGEARVTCYNKLSRDLQSVTDPTSILK